MTAPVKYCVKGYVEVAKNGIKDHLFQSGLQLVEEWRISNEHRVEAEMI